MREIWRKFKEWLRHQYMMRTSYSYRFFYLSGKGMADGFAAGIKKADEDSRSFAEYLADPKTIAFIERCRRISDFYFPDNEDG